MKFKPVFPSDRAAEDATLGYAGVQPLGNEVQAYQLRRIRELVIGAVMSSSLILLVAHLLLGYWFAREAGSEAALRVQLQVLQEKAGRMREWERLQAERSARGHVAALYQRETAAMLGTLARWHEIVCLSKLSRMHGEVVFTGFARSIDDIAAFAAHLKNTHLFSQLDIGNLRQAADEKSLEFLINAKEVRQQNDIQSISFQASDRQRDRDLLANHRVLG